MDQVQDLPYKMKMQVIDMFVKMKTTKPIKVINHDTGIYEKISPNKFEKKLIERMMEK
ncbi:hypothetical protein [Nitrososphaeria virus YSH_1032793]|uniref:Uncharacterized protein n=1 Tax=Nitrososphaeria virus YSH_1032793 TaxID=3071320 RepID=A0A976UBB1_9CAUD|nr:hypothetical protein QKV91_gp22 [Yangshan Harbor Nitrososphaeria virus]UVF62226.1 hypothetical protein [Nitrososphaeria virus YSH_1032793]